MPFLTGLAIITLAPFWADIKLDAPGVGWAAQIAPGDFAGMAALAAAVAVLGRAVLRAARAKRRRREDARRAALADPRRRWLAPAATFSSAPQPAVVVPEPVPQAPPKPAHVPASTPFSGGHVLASGLDARVFLRYRHWTGVVGDSIFQLYQVRAAWRGGRIAQLHGYCFTLRACQIIPMQDVLALGDERTGNFIFDLDAFLLGTPVHANPFGITLSPRGEHLGDPDLPLLDLPANWLEWQNLLDQQAQETARALSESAALRRAHQLPARPRGGANRPGPHKSWNDFAGVAGAGAQFLMRYLASDALLSDRIVWVSSISLSEDGAILSLSAHCERADALRTFRRERIAALGDAATGALHADIDAALRGSNVSIRQSRAVPPKAGGTVKASPGRGNLPVLEEAQQAFAAMAPDERLASAMRPAEPTPPKEKRPRGRPRKNAAPPPE